MNGNGRKTRIRDIAKKIAPMLVMVALIMAMGAGETKEWGAGAPRSFAASTGNETAEQVADIGEQAADAGEQVTEVGEQAADAAEQIASRPGFAPASPGPRAGAPAPAFSLKGLDGRGYEVGGKREKLLLLNFWASWCGPCEEEAPLLVKLYEKYAASLDLYAVNVTAEDSRANAESFAKAFAFPFPVLLDEQGQIAAKYRIFGIPTSFLINRDGDIVDVIHLADAAQWEAKISRWLQ